jgi:hypothetical protein
VTNKLVVIGLFISGYETEVTTITPDELDALDEDQLIIDDNRLRAEKVLSLKEALALADKLVKAVEEARK